MFKTNHLITTHYLRELLRKFQNRKTIPPTLSQMTTQSLILFISLSLRVFQSFLFLFHSLIRVGFVAEINVQLVITSSVSVIFNRVFKLERFQVLRASI